MTNQDNINFRLKSADKTFGRTKMSNLDIDTAWEWTIDMVDYPVKIVPAFFGTEDGDGYKIARGMTNTGRETQYQFVLCDKYRTGEMLPISSVSDTYGTMSTKTAYDDLRKQLDASGVEYKIEELYVSGNGGSQVLSIRFPKRRDFKGNEDALSLILRFDSSYDGSRSHSLNLVAYFVKDDAILDFGGKVEKLKARHTTTITDRTINFIPSIAKLLEEWDKTIIPFVMFMQDSEFDMSQVREIIEKLCEDAGIGERHTTKIVGSIENKRVTEKKMSFFDCTLAIGAYLNQNMEHKPEQQERFVKNLGKSMRKNANKFIKK